MRASLILCALVLGGCTLAGPPPRAEPPHPVPPPPSAISPGAPGVGPGSPGEAPPTSAPVPPSDGRNVDSCGAARLQHLVGQPVPQRFDVPGPVRIVAEGDPMTMDLNPQRLTVTTTRGSYRRILSLECG